MKEIEVKILEISPSRIRQILKKNNARIIMPWNKQTNIFYASCETKKSGITLRLRKDSQGCTLAVKSKIRFDRKHKSRNEYEVSIGNLETMKSGLELLGFKLIGIGEIYREDWKFKKCLVTIGKLPNIPPYVEIEGTKTDILKVAKVLGYSEKDYEPRLILDVYNIISRFLKF